VRGQTDAYSVIDHYNISIEISFFNPNRIEISIRNYYDIIPNVSSEQNSYANYLEVLIKIPARILICGPSGSGKTTICLSIFENINKFSRVILCAKDTDEVLYKWFRELLETVEKKTKTKILEVYTNLKDLPPLDSLDPTQNTFLIIDDCICESKKHLAVAEHYFIACRKKSVTACFLSQSYFDTPKLIRKNCNYICLKKINQEKDLKRILSEYKFDVSIDQMKAIYKFAIDKGSNTDFLTIDVDGPTETKFRKQFKPIQGWQSSNGE
jgi:energy-coupling factor transporter ATP-binding protein EcfA2